MTAQALKTRIEKKFGTVSNFARISGIPRYDLQKLFSVKHPDKSVIDQVAEKYQSCENRETGNVIDKAKLKQLQTAIDDAGGVYRFTEDHTQFPQRDVYDVYGGKRKRMTPFVQKLFDHFDIT